MKTPFVTPAAIFSILIINLFSICIGQTIHTDNKIDVSSIFYLFKTKGFDQLNAKLDDFQKAYDADYFAEDNLYSAFNVFAKTDSMFETIMNEWVKLFPSSSAALTARAKYYCACAWQTQGRKWNIDRSGTKYDDMEKYFSLALADIAEALDKNARLDICYSMKIEAGMATGNEELMNNALTECLSYHPYAYRIRLQYLQALTPRWGGTYQKMQTFIDSCEKYTAYNSKLSELSASIPADKGRSYAYLGRYEHAEKMFTEALKHSSLPLYYIDRGDTYAQMHDYKSALADYDQALKLCPNEPEYLERRERTLSIMTRLSHAQKMNQGTSISNLDRLGDQDQSLVNSKQAAIEHTKKASDYQKSGKYNEAVAEYNEAIRLSPGVYLLYYNRALCYLNLSNNDAALQDFLTVVEKKPTEIGVYFKITQMYADRGSYDDALNNINKVISLDPTNGQAFFYRAKVYEMRGSSLEASEDMRQSCGMGYEPACKYSRLAK